MANLSSLIGPNGIATLTGTQTLTNKTIAFNSNTLTDVASTNTSQTLTNKTLQSPNITSGLTLAGAAGTSGQALLSQGSGQPPAWGAVDGTAVTGDVILTADTRSTPAWLPATGATYSQASYPALFTKLGTIPSSGYGETGWGANIAVASNSAAELNSSSSSYIAFNGSTYVCAAMMNYYVFTSTNLTSWTQRTVEIVANNYIDYVAFGGGTFVAVPRSGTNNKVYTSTDGITWTARTITGFNAVTPYNIFYHAAGGFFLIVSSGDMFRSTDGASWTNVGAPPSPMFMAGGNAVSAPDGFLYLSDYNGRVMRTSNGTSFTVVQNTAAPSGTNSGIAYGAGRFMLGGGGGHFYTSTNGTTWSSVPTNQRPSAFPSNYSYGSLGIAFANGVFFVGAPTTANNWAYSLTGLEWTMGGGTITNDTNRKWTSANNRAFIRADANGAGTFKISHNPGFSYNTATQFITPFDNFTNRVAQGLKAYIKT